MERAACRDMTEVMFPPEQLRPDKRRAERSSARVAREEAEAQALRVCASCLVRQECLAFALRNPRLAEFGVWGGMTAQNRRGVARLARRAERGL